MMFFIAGFGYNCLNEGYDCKNGGLCDYFGRCKCPPGYKDYDCGLDSGSIRHSVVILYLVILLVKVQEKIYSVNIDIFN
jgi:hypothetical protein